MERGQLTPKRQWKWGNGPLKPEARDGSACVRALWASAHFFCLPNPPVPGREVARQWWRGSSPRTLNVHSSVTRVQNSMCECFADSSWSHLSSCQFFSKSDNWFLSDPHGKIITWKNGSPEKILQPGFGSWFACFLRHQQPLHNWFCRRWSPGS